VGEVLYEFIHSDIRFPLLNNFRVEQKYLTVRPRANSIRRNNTRGTGIKQVDRGEESTEYNDHGWKEHFV